MNRKEGEHTSSILCRGEEFENVVGYYKDECHHYDGNKMCNVRVLDANGCWIGLVDRGKGNNCNKGQHNRPALHGGIGEYHYLAGGHFTTFAMA